VRIVLVSTYELGHQPLHLALPAAALRAAGHEVTTLDLAVDHPDWPAVAAADAVAVSVPMHTATRLAVSFVGDVRARGLDVPVAFYGLYAGVGAGAVAVDAAFAGEYVDDLVAWAGGVPETPAPHTRAPLPDRTGLPGLDRYARLEVGEESRVVGYVEASRGCRHRCRHCPVPVVYDGRYRIVPVADVLADVDRLVAAGARHITFGDPDFWNGPAHAARVLEAVAARHPGVTADITVKVSHLLARPDLVARLPELGVLFVVSAFESVSDEVLAHLDKGHTAADLDAVVALCRRAGVDVHPSWLPFTPWTRPGDILGLFDFLDRHDLLGVTDPVQLSLRLLVPPGSLLLDAVGPYVDGFDPAGLTYRWHAADPAMDALQGELASLAAGGADAGTDPVETVVALWRRTLERLGGDPDRARMPTTARRARLTESWFCCAEPTEGQTVLLAARPPVAVPLEPVAVPLEKGLAGGGSGPRRP